MMRYHPRTFDLIHQALLEDPPAPHECNVIVHMQDGDTLIRYGIRHNVYELKHCVSQELFDYPSENIRMDVVANNPVTRSILTMLRMTNDELIAHSGTRGPGPYRAKLFLALCDLWD